MVVVFSIPDMCSVVFLPQECKLCSDCLKAEQRLDLQAAYLEHTRRTTWRRVFPRQFKVGRLVAAYV